MKRQRLRPGRDTRSRILGAAGTAFAERGFAGARMQDIATRARVNKAMIYYHVGNKASLYSAVLLEYRGRARRRMATAAGRGQSVEAELRLAIHSLFCTMVDMPVASRLLLHEMASAPSARRPLAAPLLPLGHRVASALERAATAGILRSRHVTDLRLVIVGTVLLSALEELRARRGRAAPDQVSATLGGGKPDIRRLSDLLIGTALVPSGESGSDTDERGHVGFESDPVGGVDGIRACKESDR